MGLQLQEATLTCVGLQGKCAPVLGPCSSLPFIISNWAAHRPDYGVTSTSLMCGGGRYLMEAPVGMGPSCHVRSAGAWHRPGGSVGIEAVVLHVAMLRSPGCA